MAEQEINSIYQDLEQKKQQMQMMLQSPQVQQQLQQNPQMAEQIKGPVQQVIASAQKAIKKISEKPTIEQVLGFLRDSRIKNFVLDIETDSTIQITEETDKKRTTEFIGVLAQLLPQLSQMIMADAQAVRRRAVEVRHQAVPRRPFARRRDR
jgi:dsDNA-specific endonuclease/ATPase MutS2